MAEPTHALESARSTMIDDQRRIIEAISSDGTLSEQSRLRVVGLAERFVAFCAQAFSITSLRDVTLSTAEAFVRAPSCDHEPSVATMHLRRSVLRLLFRRARELGLADDDPTIDLALPPRSSLRARPLTDEEVALCRAASQHSLSATRLPIGSKNTWELRHR